MTNEQALKVLENATALLQLNRQDHQIIAQALNTLRAAVSVKAAQEETRKPQEEKKESSAKASKAVKKLAAAPAAQ